MAAANSPAEGEHTWSDDTPSGFLKFSAEIRNKIYRLTLVGEHPVGVEDMHPEQWQGVKDAGRGTRTSYKTKDYPRDWCSYEEYPNPKRCTFKTQQWKNAKVSYTLQINSYSPPPTIGMLALNGQTRAEAIPIFYGANEFRFYSMSAVVPFLRDRSELSLQSMQYFHLEFEIAEPRFQTSRQEGWARTFSEFPKLVPLNLQKLDIHIYDPHFRYMWKLKLDTKMQRWVHEMAKHISNLDMLGVTFDFFRGPDSTSPNEDAKEDSPSEYVLWAFLAPKMLKKVGDEPHDARSLLKRHIRDGLYYLYGSDFDEDENQDDEGVSRG